MAPLYEMDLTITFEVTVVIDAEDEREARLRLVPMHDEDVIRMGHGSSELVINSVEEIELLGHEQPTTHHIEDN